ncbi:FAD-binding protein [Kutzneria sp. NPDC051319]|uniref:FAD-binding oxidoreductase n=1 Tax=Kutzneria sp. NPDC051319 TaxID=3155047 RepID=UPI0034441B4E
MFGVTRRRFLTGLAAGGGVALANGLMSPVAEAATGDTVAPSALTVGPTDPRYGDLVRGTNLRFTGQPQSVRIVTSADQVVPVVREAVAVGKRVAVRSGGHCYENFVADPAVQVVLDLAQLSDVGYDPVRCAFYAQPGATLEKVYKALFRGWGVTIPGGTCPSVGVGGHIAGGGYGALSRLHGLTVDHLYAVEVVVVDQGGTVRTVVATREDNDPNRDLWWAHTGGGGGNFGIVTKYWFRSPGAGTGDPGGLLPRPPAEVLVSDVSFPWSSLTEQGFARLLRNYGDWMTDHSGLDPSDQGLFSQLKPQHQVAGSFALTTLVDGSRPNADQTLDGFLAAMSAGTGATPIVNERRRLPWLHGVEWPGFTGGRNPTFRFKIKSAYLKTGFTDGQIAAIHHHLTRTDHQNPFSLLLITSYGGQVNTVAPDATAVVQRDSVLKPQFVTFWNDGDDAANIAWVRELYRDVFAGTGGVPVSNDRQDGAYINYADVDLADPAWNTSGVPWSTLYYGGNYPRLRQVKSKWDPGNRFRHALSVETA